MRYFILPLLIFSFSLTTVAGSVDTISIYSISMHKQIKAVVIMPDSYKENMKRFPVVYLLHGYDGWYSNWIIRAPELMNYADTYQTIIVCPDGAKSSWYFDSPADTSYRYETFMVKEVISFIDKNYRTIPDKGHRAITGLSMGGHGALFLALRHSDIFGAAGSMSGVVDLKQVGYRFDIQERIGDTLNYPGNWYSFSILGLVEKYTNTKLKIIFDCGVNDMFIAGNRRLHQKMLALKIPHRYTERAGAHSWDYWRSSVVYHLAFFRDIFNKN